MNPPGRSSEGLKGVYATALFWSVVAVVSAAAGYLHVAASFTLPVPWGDEAYFVWQARAFERWNSFIAPELDPSRPIFLLPFVYGATLGLVFKVVGYSLEVARWASFTFVIASFALLAILVRRHAAPFIALGLVSALVLNRHFVVLGNVARMEALVIAVLCGVLVLMQRRRRWEALALLSVTPMIHPNGMYFLIPWVIYAWVAGLFKERPGRVAVWMLLASAAIWAANGIYALSYWDGCLHDTAYRFGETSAKHDGLSQFRGWPAIELALIAAAALLATWRRVPVSHLLVIALGAWLSNFVRLEQWYEPYRDLAYLLVSLALIEIVARRLSSTGSTRGRWYPSIAAGVVGAGLLVLPVYNGRLNPSTNYVQDLRAAGMRAESVVPYFRQNDHEVIRSALPTSNRDCPVTVEVYPWGDGLLLSTDEESGVRFQVPYFDAFFQPEERWIWGYRATEYPLPDIYLVRLSRYHPRWLDDRQNQFLAHVATRSDAGPTVVHSRDGTEIWYAFRPSEESKSMRPVARQPASGRC